MPPADRPGPVFLGRVRSRIRRKLLDWYRAKHRDLPWRHTRDPYRIWLSETMLQQTRVDTVIPYYERFLEEFPDLDALATADEDAVLKAWSGLGYYARARNLKRAVETVVRDYGGRVPRDPVELRALPGIGAYTVGAIRSIAFGEEAALVDGNVKRVFARLLADKSPSDARLWRAASELVVGPDPGLFNQSLMELGAVLCTPREPQCGACPLRAECRAYASGRPSAFPTPAPRKRPRPRSATCALLRNARRPSEVLLIQRPAKGLLGGLWEMPSIESEAPEELGCELRDRFGIVAKPGLEVGQIRHLFTHVTLTLRVVEFEHHGGRLRSGSGTATTRARWCGAGTREGLPFSTLMKKALALAGL